MVFSLCLRQSLITRDQKESNREIKAGTTKYILNVMDDIFSCWFSILLLSLLLFLLLLLLFIHENKNKVWNDILNMSDYILLSFLRVGKLLTSLI